MATITVTKGYNDPTGFTSGETVTPAKLNSAQSPTAAITFDTAADTDDSTLEVGGGKFRVKDAGIVAAKLATDAVETAKIANDAVTNAKLSLSANAGEIKKALNADNDPPIYACRAWVNFDATRNEADDGASTNGANVKIRASGNVSSVLKNATGDYTVTFTTAMPDANYAVLGSVAGSTTANQRSIITASNVALAAGSVRVFCVDVNNTVNDCDSQQVAIVR